MVPSSYARAAGLQSELNKVTLTRVAGIEMEYNRRLDSYRKDMRISINSVQQEQEKLKRSLAGYSRKMRQDQRERAERLQREYEFDCRYARIMENGEEEETEDEEQEEEWEEKGADEITVGKKDNHYRTVDNLIVQNTDSFGVNDSLFAVDRLPRIFPVTTNMVRNRYPESADTWASKESVNMESSQPLKTDEHVGLKQKLNNRGMRSISYSNLIRSPQDGHTMKPNSVEKVDIPSEETKQDTRDDIHGIGHRLPDTRDNVYFRGVHGELHSSHTLIRTAAIIYPIQYGYESNKEERETRLPALQAKPTTKVSTKAQKYWRMLRQRQIVERGVSRKVNSYRKRKISSGNPESQSVSRYDLPMNHAKYWTRSNGQINLTSLARKIQSLGLRNSKETSSRHGSRLSSSVRGQSYLSGGPSRRQDTINQTSKTVWKSVFQKLKIVHTLGSLSEVFSKP